MKEYCIWGGRQRKWRRQRGKSSCFSLPNNFLLFSHHRNDCFFFLGLFMPWLEQVSWAVSPKYNRSKRVNSYICLDELTALFSYSAHKAKDIHPLFHVHHVDHAVNDNERPSSPHPSTVEKKKVQGLAFNKPSKQRASNKNPTRHCK